MFFLCCRRTEAEGQIEEISGVAFIFNQKFFNDLFEAKGIDLENIVYYKDETHYFVMTAKKQSLIDKGTQFLRFNQNLNSPKELPMYMILDLLIMFYEMPSLQ